KTAAERSGLRYETIPRLPDSDRYALSHAQKRLWLLAELNPESSEYNMMVSVRLDGDLDTKRFADGLHALAERHESLRTVFATQDGEPFQRIHVGARIPLRIDDLSVLPPKAVASHVERFARDEVQTPFRLERELPCRARLIRVEAQSHILIVTMHHIVSDGWSMDVLQRELLAAYRGGAGFLPALPLRYVDFAGWQNAQLQRNLQGHEEFWLRELTDLPSLELPRDFARPAKRSGRGTTVVVPLASNLSASLRVFARDRNATIYVTLLSAFTLLLARLSGQTDVV